MMYDQAFVVGLMASALFVKQPWNAMQPHAAVVCKDDQSLLIH